MRADAFWKAVTLDRSDFLESFMAVLDQPCLGGCKLVVAERPLLVKVCELK